jgi:hypothetical protein
MAEKENQFSLTRVAFSTGGRAKKHFLISLIFLRPLLAVRERLRTLICAHLEFEQKLISCFVTLRTDG